MPKLFSFGNRAANAIPKRLTTLSLSWLARKFRAIAVRRGVIEATWEYPGEVDDAARFEGLIREAVQQTGYGGLTVSLVLSQPRLMHQMVDVPPLKGGTLRKVLRRQAGQQKLFVGEAAWTFQTAPSTRGRQRVLIHLFPKVVLNQLTRACQRNGLHLTAVLFPSAVLCRQFSELGLEKQETALLAAHIEGSTVVVVGRGDGQMLLTLRVPGTWNDGAERLAQELNRTIHFVEREYGVSPCKGAWLFGPGALEHCPLIGQHTQFPVKVSPVAYDPFYWASEALKLPSALTPNFISPELRKAPQRRLFAKVVATGAVMAVSAAVAAWIYASAQARQESASIKTMSDQLGPLRAKQRQLHDLDAELSRKSQVLNLIVGQRPPPAPAWLLACLGEAIPADLVITNFQIKRADGCWKVRLAGVPQGGVRQPKAPPLTNSVALLKTRLSGNPFHFSTIGSGVKGPGQPGEQAKPGASGQSSTNWLARMTGTVTGELTPARAVVEDRFVIEGVVR
jgi:hypothetical protein